MPLSVEITLLPILEKLNVRIAKGINRLFGSPDAEKVGPCPFPVWLQQTFQEDFLDIVRVLVFIDHDVTEARAYFLGNILVFGGGQKFEREGGYIFKCEGRHRLFALDHLLVELAQDFQNEGIQGSVFFPNHLRFVKGWAEGEGIDDRILSPICLLE